MKYLLFAASAAAVAFFAAPGLAAVASKAPKRVLIVVFDQMRPEYAERFGMRNVLSLRDRGVSFPHAYLGYVGSETVVSHNVMVSGVFPKNQGWVDEAYRDAANLLGKGAGAMWVTSSLTREQFGVLVRAKGYPKLADYLHRAEPGTKFIVVGEKSYPVDSIAAPSADIAVRFSDRSGDVSKETGCANLGGAWRFPAGFRVPAYLTEPKCGRFYVNSDKSNDYGTEAKSPSRLYPEDGNRMVPGRDPGHLGGDAWAADAAMAMMEKENWSGMLVTLGAMDKSGHMWGAYHDQGVAAGAPDGPTHLPAIARFADEQLGRMLKKLKDLGQLDETLVVVTSDHGATYAKEFHGNDAAGAAEENWFHGRAVNAEDYDKPPAALKPLLDAGNVRFSYQSTSIEAWLKDGSTEKKRAAARAMRALPGVAAVYWRDGDRFRLDAAPGQGTAAVFGAAELAWWKKRGQAIVDTMAADNGPDVIGILADEVGYGAYGDHGSAKESDQRVPMIFWASNIGVRASPGEFRTVDLLPTVLKAMGIRQTRPGDGKAWPLEFR